MCFNDQFSFSCVFLFYLPFRSIINICVEMHVWITNSFNSCLDGTGTALLYCFFFSLFPSKFFKWNEERSRWEKKEKKDNLNRNESNEIFCGISHAFSESTKTSIRIRIKLNQCRGIFLSIKTFFLQTNELLWFSVTFNSQLLHRLIEFQIPFFFVHCSFRFLIFILSFQPFDSLRVFFSVFAAFYTWYKPSVCIACVKWMQTSQWWW